MNHQFLRGACVIIEGGGKRILCDPWLTDGEYYGSWAHYPTYEWKDNLAVDYIYVSHIHPDHFSAATMKRLNKVPVLIHKFHSKFLKKNIEDLGFEVRELPHNTEVDLGGIKINIIAADDCDPVVCQKFFGCTDAEVGTTQIDSMAVFTDGKQVYVNANDCPYQLSKTMLPKVRMQYPEIDLLMVAYAGAGPYPQCFKMPFEKKQQVAQFKKGTFLNHAAMFAKDLRAKTTLPFAGDYMLCGPFAKLNRMRGVATLGEVYDYFDLHEIPVARGEIPDENARQKYANEVLSKRVMDYDSDTQIAAHELSYWILGAFKRMEAKRRELGLSSETVVYLALDDGTFMGVPMNGDDCRIVPFTYADRRIIMDVPPKLLKRLIRGPKYAHWNNAEIGSHITFDRQPDDFERGVHHIMSFLHV